MYSSATVRSLWKFYSVVSHSSSTYLRCLLFLILRLSLPMKRPIQNNHWLLRSLAFVLKIDSRYLCIFVNCIMICHACAMVNQIKHHSFLEDDMLSKSFFISCTRLTLGRSDGTYSSCFCYCSTIFYSSRTFTHTGTLSVVLLVFKREGFRISVDTPYVSFFGETATGCAWILLSLV